MMRKIFLALVIITILILISSTLAFGPVTSRKDDPLPSESFLVEIDGIASTGFTHIEGLDAETEVVEYREGAESNSVRLIPGLYRYGPLILKRGLTENTELWEWFEENRDDPVDRKAMSVIFFDRGRNEKVRFNFKDCWPSEYYIEPISSSPSDIAIEVIVIQYESMERVYDDS
jgi:phage tail-like protein